MQSNVSCVSCFRAVGNLFVTCISCNGYYHKLCSGIINDHHFHLIKSSKNIVYNCNNCVNSCSDLYAKVSVLSEEIQELKQKFCSYENNKNATDRSSFKNKQKNAKECLNSNRDEQRRVHSPLRDSFPSNSANLVSSGVNANNVVVAAEVNDNARHNSVNVTTEPSNVNAVNSLNKIRSRRDSICLADNPDSETEINASDLKSNEMRSRRESFCLSVSSASVAATAKSHIPVHNTEWIDVKSKRKMKRSIFGANENNDLDVIANKKWIHLSSFKSSVTVEQILNYIWKYSNIGKDKIDCYKLVKKDANLNELKKISFKIGVNAEIYKEIYKPSLWPANVRLRPFQIFSNK